LLAEILEVMLVDPTLSAAVGHKPRLSNAKFLAPVRPGAQLTLHLTLEARCVRFEVLENERVAAAGQFERVIESAAT
jgi:3-hydroxyacyl-[acyl-carrier-protein] dehydratase